MPVLTAAIVEDHPLMRSATRSILEATGEVRVLWEAATAREARQQIANHPPDVLLLDVGLPDGSGIELAGDVRAIAPSVQVLVFTAHDEPPYLAAALAAGVSGYLLKSASAEALLSAVQAVRSGELVLRGVAAAAATPAPMSGVWSANPLSGREAEVLGLAARGLPNKVIARMLQLSVRTVETHVSNILRKLGVSSRTEAVVLAATHHRMTLVDREADRLPGLEER